MALKEMYPGMVNSPETTITNNISESDTIIYVLDPARVPEPPNLMTLGTGTNAETVRVIEINGNAITVERGFQGIPKAWPAGTVIARNFTEYDYRALKENIEDIANNLASHKNESATGAHMAKNIAIEDAGGHFTATDVEGALRELFTSVSDGKTQLETAITDKGGTVSKAGNVATFDELDDGIRSIPVGDYAVGDTIRDSVMRGIPGGMGVEIWSKTDAAYGWGIAVDSAGYVYCAHAVGIRKLDSSGNEIWSKTDAGSGRGIAVDSAGYVYCAHAVGIRKLDSSGNEIWSKTDVADGRGIAVDSAGYVYCAHAVGIRKLDSSGNEIWSKTDVADGWGIAVDSAGYVYCAHAVGIRKLDSSGNEIWSKTDAGSGRGIAVDSAGYVYCAHYVGIRKLDSSGNEIWSKTDVADGWGIAVDSAGYVYCAHAVGIRKLDSSGNEIWSKTDVADGWGIAVDSAGYVYCAHHVSSGKAIRKLDGNRYFQILG